MSEYGIESDNYYFILDGNRNVLKATSMEWAAWLRDSDRGVARTDLTEDTMISTVFLGFNHNYSGEGEPILWESLVFGGPEDGYMTRCSGTWQDAEAMHNNMVEEVKIRLGLTRAAVPVSPPTKQLRKLT